MGSIIIWNRNLGFFTNSYNYAALVLPLMIVAPMFMRGEVELGVVTQSAGAFAQVLAAVSLIITQFGGLSAYLAGIQRLGSLWDNLDEHDAEEERIVKEANLEVADDSRLVKLDKMTVRTPDGSKTLVTDLSFELRRKQSLLIMGASGTGKSSVLRTHRRPVVERLRFARTTRLERSHVPSPASLHDCGQPARSVALPLS